MKLSFKNPWLVASVAVVAGVMGYAIRSARAGIPQGPSAMVYAGVLQDDSGNPLPSPQVLTLNLWQEQHPMSGDTPLCAIGPSSVPLGPDGSFQIALSKQSCFDGISNNATTWTEILVGATSTGVSPNNAVPYQAVEILQALDITRKNGLCAVARMWLGRHH